MAQPGSKRLKMNSLHSHLGSDFVASLPDLSFALSCLDGTNVELRQHWIDEVHIDVKFVKLM